MIADPSLNGRLACLTSYACQYDPRFSYFVYVPSSFGRPEQPENYGLVILVHGAERGAETYRNKFRGFARRHDCVVLAPLFPAGLFEPDSLDNYNFLRYRDIAYDAVLLKMVEEAARRFPIRAERFLLHGFSGGGQFVHRFLYLYPQRLAAISIGAPGEITLPREDLDWPAGLRGLRDIRGERPDLRAVGEVPVQIVVGDQDQAPRLSNYDQAANRQERARLLADSLTGLNCKVQLDFFPGAGHDGFKILPAVEEYLGARAERLK